MERETVYHSITHIISKAGVKTKVMNLVVSFKQKTAYEMRIRDWSSDVCSSDLQPRASRTKSSRSWPKNSSSPTNMLGAPNTPRLMASSVEIGRGSCRERVCQYV